MEQSISARLLGEVVECEGNEARLTHILKRDSFHYRTPERLNKKQRRGERQAGVEIRFITEPQSRNLSLW